MKNHFASLIYEQYLNRPDHIALYSPHRQPLSYRGLINEIQKTITVLYKRNIHGQDRVAVLYSQGPEMACLCLGVACVAQCYPLNPVVTAYEVNRYISALNINLLIIENQYLSLLGETIAKLRIPYIVIKSDHAQPAGTLCFEITDINQSVLKKSLAESHSDDIAYILQTSGTTGSPKYIPLSHNNIQASQENIQSVLGLSIKDVCLNMMPQFHIGAILDLLIVPLSYGCSVIIPPSISTRQFFNCLFEYKPTWYQAVPAMLNDIVRVSDNDKIDLHHHTLRFIRSVSSPLTNQLLKEIEDKFSIPVIEIYGMTETCGQITSNPLSKKGRKSGSTGKVIGLELKILDTGKNPLGVKQAGEIVLRGKSIMQGYLPHENINTQQVTGRWFHTGDYGYLDEDGYLYLNGRINELINRGGEKISPREIEDVLNLFPAIEEAACFAMPHESLGEEIAAALVVKQGIRLDEKKLIKYASDKLAHFKIPRKYFYIDQLPKGPGGKISRKKLYELCLSKHLTQRQTPSTIIAKDIAKLWMRLIKCKYPMLEDNFFEMGGDSLNAVSLITEIEKKYNVSLDMSDLIQDPTIRGIELLITQSSPRQMSRVTSCNTGYSAYLPDKIYKKMFGVLAAWNGHRRSPQSLIIGHNILGKKRPLFWCINAFSEFSQLSKHAGPDQPVYGMRSLYKLFDKSERNNKELAAHYVDEILGIQTRGPYLLGGFCEGAKIAFEIAEMLENKSHHVEWLCLHEQFIPRKYKAPVAMFIGLQNRHSPYHRFFTPEAGWRKYYGGPIHLSLFDIHHEKFYQEPYVGEFVKKLTEVINSQQADPRYITRQNNELQLLSETAYHAQIKTPLFTLLSPREKIILPVAIKNLSQETWKKSEKSGITLCNRWFKGKQKLWKDSYVFLDDDVHPGQETTLHLNITAPAHIGLWILDIDLVDQGITWFQDKGSKKAHTQALVLDINALSPLKKMINKKNE